MTLSQQAPSLVERQWEEAVQKARKAIYDDGRGMIGANRNYLQDRVARAILAEQKEAAARITELEGDLKAAFREISKLAREAGEAKGRLAMSEAAGIVDGWRERAERAEAQCRVLQRIVDLARELVSPAGMVNRGVDRGLVVVEKADKSDPHYRLCAALDALSLSGGGGREEKGSLPESPSADAGPYPRSHDDQRSDGGRG